MDLTPIVSVIDEDPLWRSAVGQAACALGLGCRQHASGPEFVEGLGVSLPGCVVLDFRIPGLSGLEIQQHLAVHAPALPVVFVGGRFTVSMAVRAMRAGAMHVLEKPLREGELLESLQEAVQLNRLRRAAERERRRAEELISKLTAAEMQVLKGITSGQSSGAMATQLRVSQRTVELRRSRVLKKLGAKSVPDVVYLVITASNGNGHGTPPWEPAGSRRSPFGNWPGNGGGIVAARQSYSAL